MAKMKGLATGIGSLPYTDADRALDLILRYVPRIPFWPQLPKRDMREGMVAQFSEHLPCLKITRQGLIFDAQQKEKELEAFYERIINNDVDYFMLSEDFTCGLYRFIQRLEKLDLHDVEFIKGQITGPFTFAASIKDELQMALLHDGVMMQAIVKGLSMKALWQINAFKKFKKKIILFIDEPYLGCFGSAYTPINREDVIRGLSELTQAVKSDDVLIGVHCCGNTDWSIFTDIPSINIINFDAFGFQDRFVLYAKNIQEFLARGGIICWGIVPTQEFTGSESAASLIDRIKQGIEQLAQKGVSRQLLSERLLISPSCGLGTLEPKKSEDIFKLLQETAFCLKQLA